VVPDNFQGIGAWRDSTVTQQSGHAQRSGPEFKNGSSAKDSAPENPEGGELAMGSPLAPALADICMK